MNMFYNYVVKYINNIDKEMNINATIIPIEFSTIKSLEVDDIEKSSADFHCYPKIIDIIIKKFPQYDSNQIKKCIWDCNSKYNSRYDPKYLFTHPDIFEIWKVIESYVFSLQKNLIDSRH